MNTLFVDSRGLLSFNKIFTGLGPVNGVTHWEHSVVQAILMSPNAELMSNLSEVGEDGPSRRR